MMIDTLDDLIRYFGLSLRASEHMHGVRTSGNVIIVNPHEGNVLLLMTAVGKCLETNQHPNPAVRIAMCSYTGWSRLLEMRSYISNQLYEMLVENALIRSSLDTLTTQLMTYGMATAFAVAGDPLPITKARCRFQVASELRSEDVLSSMETSMPSFPEDVEAFLNAFINRL